MDIQQYISSGIIEAYVLGIATEEEVRELELLSTQHPEISAAVEAYQQDLEKFSGLHAIDPPKGLKEQIWSELEKETPRPRQEPETIAGLDRVQSRRAVPFEKHKAIPKPSFSNRGIAAAVILLIGSVIGNAVLWNQSQSVQKEIVAIKAEQQSNLVAYTQTRQQLEQYEANIRLMLNPAVKSVPLSGVGEHGANNATVLWDTRSREVYLSLNNLPPAPEGKQYQLWAIVDGKPVDAGVFARNGKDLLQRMKVIPSAQMFAITLEKEGGSPGPTMDQMYVAGKV